MTNRPSRLLRHIPAFFMILVIVILPFRGWSQGELVVNKDSRVDLLVEKHIEINEAMDGIRGFRIQVFFASGTDSRDRANAIKSEILKSIGDHEVYVLFEAPYYKVRVGDFRTHLDAERALQQIRLLFPGAFIVEDRIRLPRL